MSYKPGDAVYAEFITSSPMTSGATNADSLPTGKVNRNGVDDGTVTVTVANVATGRYYASFTLPVGYAAGDSVSVHVDATVGGVAGKGVIARFALDGKRVADLQDPSATSIASAVWDTLTSGARAAGSYGAKLKAWVLGTDFKAVLSTDAAQPAPSWWVAPDNADVATALSDLVSLLGRTDPTTAISTLQTTANAIKAKTDQAQFQTGYVLATVYNGGTGAYAVTVHVTDGTNPVVGARVRLFSQGGQSFTGNTDASGNASFSLDAGSYTLTITENGYSYAPTTQVIGGAATITAAMTQESVPAATLPGQTNAYLHTYDAGGNAAAGVIITFVLVSAPGQNSYGLTKTATSDGTGLLQISLLQNTSYQARRGSGPWIPFTTGASGTYPLPQVLGDA